MKKFLLTLVVATLSLTASAQVYVGGEVGFWRNYNSNQTTFSLAPEVGYTLSEDWAIGLSLDYDYLYNAGSKKNSFTVAPYARYTFAKFGPCNLFLDGGLGFATYKYKGASNSNTGWYVGIKPGVAVNLTEKLSFVAHVGFLGYRDSDDDHPYRAFGSDGFGFNVDGNNLTFGLYYNF